MPTFRVFGFVTASSPEAAAVKMTVVRITVQHAYIKPRLKHRVMPPI